MSDRARDHIFVAVDFESTGTVSGYPDEPWQVGTIPISNGCLMVGDAYESFLRVSTDRPFSPFAPGSWRLVRNKLASAPALPDLLPELAPRLNAVALVAHNASTEKKYFRKAWPLHRPGPWIDTLKLTRLACPGMPDYSLENVVQTFGLGDALARLFPARAPHDALYDAAACGLVLGHLLDQPGWEKVTVHDLIRAASRRTG